MILDSNDPTGLGLFSKCARNQASKLKSNRPATAGRRIKQVQEDTNRRKINTHCSFDRQESREQRERKYHREETPPVGKYNPVIGTKPKMVWDILKIYGRAEKKRRVPVLPKQPSEMIQEKGEQNRVQTEPMMLGNEQRVDESAGSFNPKQQTTSSMMSMGRSQCMVNMSRMTGRRHRNNESQDWGDADVMKSVDYVKGKITKNISIGKQLRERPQRGLVNSVSNYAYDYDCIKPRRWGLVNFGVGRGREQKLRTETGYSYQHYDYEGYVWSSKSRVFPNTKTHLIEFSKQTNRYRETERASRQQVE